MLRSRQPNYPSSARSASIEGTTTVRILVGYEGEVESVAVAESSGNAALDDAAVEACYNWRFSGAKMVLDKRYVVIRMCLLHLD